MQHLDARTIRERLNAITLAISTLEKKTTAARHHEIAALAREALAEIATLVTRDEIEEHQAGRVCLRDPGARRIKAG